jgi:hypothetical protein
MSWVVFSYSLPAAQRSSARVAIWRRLRAIGAVSPKGGVYVLPAREECVEAFQWLAQEVEQAKGEALLMRVANFEGLSDAQLIDLFRQARKRDYDELDAKAAALEKSVGKQPAARADARTAARDALAKLRREHAEIVRTDFFDSPERVRVAARLTRIAEALSPKRPARIQVAPAAVGAYRDKRWVTRPHPHVDRLACIWLIRRFINPQAVVRYAARPKRDEVAFDMSEGEFGHRGNLCTFETMLKAFGMDDPGLRALAEVVHEIDLRDGRYTRSEIAGVDAILRGWEALADAEREAHGVALFEGLYAALSQAGLRRPRKKAR